LRRGNSILEQTGFHSETRVLLKNTVNDLIYPKSIEKRLQVKSTISGNVLKLPRDNQELLKKLDDVQESPEAPQKLIKNTQRHSETPRDIRICHKDSQGHPGMTRDSFKRYLMMSRKAQRRPRSSSGIPKDIQRCPETSGSATKTHRDPQGYPETSRASLECLRSALACHRNIDSILQALQSYPNFLFFSCR
jgi:hypothetical protein